MQSWIYDFSKGTFRYLAGAIIGTVLFSFVVGDSGVYRRILNKADINKDGDVSDEELSLFYDTVRQKLKIPKEREVKVSDLEKYFEEK